MPLNAFLLDNLFSQSFLDGKRNIADPKADEVVQNVIDQEGEWAAQNLFNQLIKNVDLPYH